MVVLEGGGLLSGAGNQYLQPDYLSPLPTTVRFKTYKKNIICFLIQIFRKAFDNIQKNGNLILIWIFLAKVLNFSFFTCFNAVVEISSVIKKFNNTLK